MNGITILVAAVAAVACAWPSATLAATRNDVFWSTPPAAPAITEARQDVRITQAVTMHYAAFGGWFADNTNADDGWYMGLQADGVDFQGNSRPQMIFSVWNATVAAPGAGARCAPFGGEGIGRSCRLRIDWKLGHPYRYAIVKAPGSATVWAGYVIDAVTGAVREVGRIAAPPANVALRDFYSFLEYWGSGCAHAPLAAQFSNPQLNGGAMQATYPGSNSLGPCSLGAINAGPEGVGAILGAGSAPPPPPFVGSLPPLQAAAPSQIAAARLASRRLRPTRRRLTPVVRPGVRTGGGGARLTLTMTRPATAHFSLRRARRGRAGTITVANARLKLGAAAHRLRLTGRNNARGRLPPGRYTLVTRLVGDEITRLRPIALTIVRAAR